MQNLAKPKRPDWTIMKLILWAAQYFKSNGIDSPRTTAEILLAHALKLKRIDLYVRYDQPLLSGELEHFKSLIKRRINREPVAYIVGGKEFWSMELAVTEDVLIPRPETECLVEAALQVLGSDSNPQPKRILELGTGSGAVVLALASQNPRHLYFASDVSAKAIEVAVQNASCHCLDARIHFFSGDWFSALRMGKSSFDLILSNPPYIKTGVLVRLQPEILEYEPAVALDGGEDGLRCLRHLIAGGHSYLKPGGTLLLEIAHDQKEDVYKVMTECGRYECFACTQDYSGYDRVVRMRKKMLQTII
jgi:release factor glutamine methyltransferase